MKTIICYLFLIFFPFVTTCGQSAPKIDKPVHIDSFYIDETEIRSGERYKEFPVNATRSKIKSSQKESPLNLLRNKYWTTCALFDSLNQYPVIQLISKTRLAGFSNCTDNGGAQSEWFFSDTGKVQILKIKMQTGWDISDQMRTQSSAKWRWQYDTKSNNIYIYKLQEKGITESNSERALFCLFIKKISKDNIIFSVLKL